MKEAFLEDFDTLLHNYIAECDTAGNYENITEVMEYNHTDGHKYKVALVVVRK